MKILLPVDGSEYSERMLAFVVERGELLGSRHDYVAFTAVAPLPSHGARFIDDASLEAYHAESAERVLKPIRAFAARHTLKLRCEFRVGHAATVIADFATAEQPDLIVMGSRGHGAFGSAFLGSVAVGVISRCRTLLLLVR